jgi:MFS family permease
MVSGSSLYVFSLMMTSISHEYYQFFLSQGLGVGLAMGILFAPLLATIVHHFGRTKYRHLAFGILAAGVSVGGAVFPVMLRSLFTQLSFGWAVRTCTSKMLLPLNGGYMY